MPNYNNTASLTSQKNVSTFHILTSLLLVYLSTEVSKHQFLCGRIGVGTIISSLKFYMSLL